MFQNNQDILSRKHLERYKANVDYFASPAGHFLNMLEDGLKKNYLKNYLKDFTSSMDETMSKNIYDIIEHYRILFVNLELYVQEHLNRKTIDHREAIDVLISFSIAGEGTNLLYERISELVIPALKQGKYTFHDIELIVNYMPTEYWEQSKIYQLIPQLIINEIDKFNNKEILSFFQAFSYAPQVPKELFNKLINKFIKEVNKDNASKEEIFSFLEIYAIMIDAMRAKADDFDSKLLLGLISKHIYKKYLLKSLQFSLSEIAELYWIYGVLDILESSDCKEEVTPLELILNDILTEYIVKHKPLSAEEIYDGVKQELEFDEKNINAIRFYYEKYGDEGALSNSKQIIKTIDSIKKKYDDRPENERKWFVI